MEVRRIGNKRSGYAPKEILYLILINIFPLFLLLLLIPDLKTAIETPSSYPFGDSINPSASIYVSETRYILFHVIQIVFLLLFIAVSFLRDRFKAAFYIISAINLFLLLYPILTARD